MYYSLFNKKLDEKIVNNYLMPQHKYPLVYLKGLVYLKIWAAHNPKYNYNCKNDVCFTLYSFPLFKRSNKIDAYIISFTGSFEIHFFNIPFYKRNRILLHT
jgi:hypothetical protein